MERITSSLDNPKRKNAASDPLLVAEIIYEAATDEKTRLRYRACADAQQLRFLRRLLGPTLQIKIMKKFMGLK